MAKRKQHKTAPWDCEPIQFARVLAELGDVVGEDHIDQIAERLNLTGDRVNEIIGAADEEVTRIAEREAWAGAPGHEPPYAAMLDDTFCESEKGHFAMSSDEEPNYYILIRLFGTIWLEIDITSQNYPFLEVQLVNKTDADLAKHIHKTFNGRSWTVLKCNIAGVKLDEGGQHLEYDEDLDEADEE